ncbi:hypothetical protein F4824DRAFT_461185 [Ustulina deusta]|nr:hypothetical protein F4824DRAFT_484884 [Ustulina deusta]KAI3338119.1 hypothetical protein F4824DRAFT_461185 [Ustulina deusta]
MTESCSCITAHQPWAYNYRSAHNVGTIVASAEVKVVKEDRAEAGVGESDEILLEDRRRLWGIYIVGTQHTKHLMLTSACTRGTGLRWEREIQCFVSELTVSDYEH